MASTERVAVIPPRSAATPGPIFVEDGESTITAQPIFVVSTVDGQVAALNRSFTTSGMMTSYDEDDVMQPEKEPYFCYDEVQCCIMIGETMCDSVSYIREKSKKVDAKNFCRKRCTLDKVKEFFPVLTWLPKYRLPDLQGDIIAGLTVGLTVLPQSIAYAKIAELPLQYGLYSAFIGSFVYVIFGTAKDVTLGPSAIMSLLTANFARSPLKGDPTYAIILCFFSGLVQIGMGLLKLGFIMDFISFPVIKAFTSAAAITIAMSQVKVWLGLKNIPSEFLSQLYWTVIKIPETRLSDFSLGCCCIILIITFRKLKEMKWKLKFEEMPIWQKILNKICWVIGTARNVIVIILATGVSAILYRIYHLKPFGLVGYIPPGLPSFQVPKFSIMAPNSTDVEVSLGEICETIGAGFILVPIIGLIEAMSIAKVFAKRGGYKVNPNQELIAYGIGNALGSFVQNYPGTGTFSRTAVNYQSGVRTPAGGILTGVIVLLAIQYLTPLFFFIPLASLAVVIILAVFDMITFHKVSVFWKSSKVDLIPWFLTFIFSFVLGLQYGVIIGAAMSIFLLIYPATRPKVKVKNKTFGRMREDPKGKVVIIQLSTGLLYPAIEFIKRKVMSACRHHGRHELPKGVILDCQHVAVIDSSVIQGVRQLFEDFNEKGIKLVLCHLQPTVQKSLQKSKLRFYNQASTIQEAVQIICFVRSNEAEHTDTENMEDVNHNNVNQPSTVTSSPIVTS